MAGVKCWCLGSALLSWDLTAIMHSNHFTGSLSPYVCDEIDKPGCLASMSFTEVSEAMTHCVA